MEKAGLVIRTSDSSDRRTNIIRLTAKGENFYTKAEPYYDQQIRKMMTGLNQSEQKKLISTLEKVRADLKE
jgi:DNA-binding MarR family transcriptional regulator